MKFEYDTNYRFERGEVLFITRFRFYFNVRDHLLLEHFPEDSFVIHLELTPARFVSCSKNIEHKHDDPPNLTHNLKFSLATRSYREPLSTDDEPSWVTEEYSVTQKAPLINGLNIMDLINDVRSQASTKMREVAGEAEGHLRKAHSRPRFHIIDTIDYRRDS